MAVNWGSAILSGAIRTIPLATGFVAWTAARNRGWGNWGSAFAASGVAVLSGVGAAILESQVASASLEDVITAQLGISGIGQNVATPGDIRRAGYFGQTLAVPSDIRRAGYFNGLSTGATQRVPRRMQYTPRGPLGAIQVSREFRRYS
jgi:hypothetical protein